MGLETIKPHPSWDESSEKGALTRQYTLHHFDSKAIFLEVILYQVIRYLLGRQLPLHCEVDLGSVGRGLQCIWLGRPDAEKSVCATPPPGNSLIRWIPEAPCFHSPQPSSSLLASGCNTPWRDSHCLSSCLLAWGFGGMLILVGYYDFFFFPLSIASNP